MPNSDVIEFECPRCLKNLRVAQSQANQRIDCPACEGSLLVPGQSTGQDLFDDLFESPAPTPTPVPTASSKKPKQKPKKKQKPASSNPLDDLDVDFPEGNTDSTDSPLKVELAGDIPLEILDDAAEEPLLELIEDNPLDGLFKRPQGDIDELAANDPFAVDPDAPIKIDGVGDTFSHDDVFGIKCNVCDTRIHVRPEQIDTEVECPICYSKVKVIDRSGKKSQKWDDKGKGRYTAPLDTDELRLSDPVERPKVDIDESFGLAPVEDDLLAPQAKPEAELELEPEPAPRPKQAPREETPLLEILNDDEELELTPAAPVNTPPKHQSRSKSKSKPSEPTTKKKRVSSGQRSRRAALEAAQQRQEQADDAGGHAPAIGSTSGKDFPDFNVADLFGSAVGMLKSSGVLIRVAVALALMLAGALAMEWIMPKAYVAEEIDAAAAKYETIFSWFKAFAAWLVFGCIPYMLGVVILWMTCSFIYRDAALGKQAVTSWKTRGRNELLSTILIFSFGFFVAGLPAALPIMILTMIVFPMRFLLGPLLMIGAWHNQSPFQIVSVDAFNTVSKNKTQWTQFYMCMGILAGLGVLANLIFFMRAITQIYAVDAIALIVGILLSTGLTLLFAPICGWHCGGVMESLENADKPQ